MGKNFVKETKAELKKVIWPSRQEVINGTGVVIIMVAIVGVIILGFDFVSSWSVGKIMTINSTSNQSVIEQHDHDHADDVVESNEESNTDVVPDSNTEVSAAPEVVDEGSAE